LGLVAVEAIVLLSLDRNLNMVKKGLSIRRNITISPDMAKQSDTAVEHHGLDNFNQYIRMLVRKDLQKIKKS